MLIQQGLVTMDIGYLFEMGLLCLYVVLIFSITSHVVLFPNRPGRGLDSLEALLVAVVSPGIVNHTGKGLL